MDHLLTALLVLLLAALPFNSASAACFMAAPMEESSINVEFDFTESSNSVVPLYNQYINNLYDQMGLYYKGLSRQTFDNGFRGYLKMKKAGKNRKSNLLTIVDFDQPSTSKRLYVLDLDRAELLFHTLVSHGKQTGGNMATKFSNISGSHQSSLGFAITAETYIGRNGYSMRLDGLEAGWNSKLRPRAVVMHGADYVSEDFIREHGRLGRSYGCPALPQELNREILNLIRNGSCLYQHKTDSRYQRSSKYLDQQSALRNFDQLIFSGS